MIFLTQPKCILKFIPIYTKAKITKKLYEKIHKRDGLEETSLMCRYINDTLIEQIYVVLDLNVVSGLSHHHTKEKI